MSCIDKRQSLSYPVDELIQILCKLILLIDFEEQSVYVTFERSVELMSKMLTSHT